MALTCDNCGAPLTVRGGEDTVVCKYCGQSTLIRKEGEREPRPKVRPAPPQPIPQVQVYGDGISRTVRWSVGVAILVTVFSVLMGVPAFRQLLFSSEPSAPPPMVTPTPTPPEVPAPMPVPQPEMPPAAGGESIDPLVIAADAPKKKSSSKKKKSNTAEASTPAPAGPILSKQEAQKVLEPKILSCMKQHNVHYLIADIGQGYGKFKSGTLPPLKVVETPYVNYKPTPGFSKSPLGKCVLAAAAPIRVSAFKGNYMYFGLRNPGAPDPLAGRPESIDRPAAESALANLDNEARQCQIGAPDGSKPGETVSISVTFQGIDGSTTKVEPVYVKYKSPYGKCLRKVYGKAKVPTFRRLTERVMHQLAP